MAKKKLTPEQEKEIKLLQANNEMLQRTKEEAKLRGTENAVQRIELAQQDVYEQVKKIDKSIAEKMMKANGSSEEKSVVTTMIENHYSDESIFDVLKQQEEKEQIKVKEEPIRVEQVVKEAVFSNTDFNNIDMDVQYDVISLPSNGECYRNKTERVPVGYLTAYDENFILSISHDEVVHGKQSMLYKMPGDEWQQAANLRAFMGYMYAHPGKKLNFMGTEFAQSAEWNHDSQLQWWLLQFDKHQGQKNLIKDFQ